MTARVCHRLECSSPPGLHSETRCWQCQGPFDKSPKIPYPALS